MLKNLLPLFLFFALLVPAAYAAPVVGAERTRNLRQLDYAPMLMEYHGQTVGDSRQFFTYPRRNYDFIRNFEKTEGNALVYYSDSIGSGDEAHRFAIAASPLLGLDYRGGESLGDTIWPGIDGGLYLRGYADSIDFDLDARIYTENRSASETKSYDLEIFEKQTKARNSGAEYISYSRYRAHLGFNYAYMRLQLARDVLHWGPGFYNNLTLNQFALPYNMLVLDFTLGSFRVFSVFADLRIDDWLSLKMNAETPNSDDRNLYAHRYEWSLIDGDLTLGMSEILVLYNSNKPWNFVPIVPLFMEKRNFSDHTNNGALAFDVNYRLFRSIRFYGEFFLDDMESPIAVYENKYSNNRWAAMLGMHTAHNFSLLKRRVKTGTIVEIARVEPYTYGHYNIGEGQLANLGFPLGNPNGPNSLSVDWTLYGSLSVDEWQSVFIGLHNQWLWKGSDLGSDINDPYKTIRKRFIHNAKMHYNATPSISYRGRYVSFTGEFTLGNDPAVYLRTMIMF